MPGIVGSKYNFKKLSGLFFSFVFSWLTAQSAIAAVDFASAPVTVRQPIPPNILFIIDDSGSMDWFHLPDTISSDCNESDMRDASNVYCHSSSYNEIYYNPNFVYEAPVDGSGTSLGQADPAAAPKDGYQSNSSTTNLYAWDGGQSPDSQTTGSCTTTTTSNGSSTTEQLFAKEKKRAQGQKYCKCAENWKCDQGEVEFVTSLNGDSLYRCLTSTETETSSSERTRFWLKGTFNTGGSSTASTGTTTVIDNFSSENTKDKGSSISSGELSEDTSDWLVTDETSGGNDGEVVNGVMQLTDPKDNSSYQAETVSPVFSVSSTPASVTFDAYLSYKGSNDQAGWQLYKEGSSGYSEVSSGGISNTSSSNIEVSVASTGNYRLGFYANDKSNGSGDLRLTLDNVELTQGGGSTSTTSSLDVRVVVREQTQAAGYYCPSDGIDNDVFVCRDDPKQASSGDRYWLLEDQATPPQKDSEALYADNYDADFGSEQRWYCDSSDRERAYFCDSNDIKWYNGDNDWKKKYWLVGGSGATQVFAEYWKQGDGYYCDDNREAILFCKEPLVAYDGTSDAKRFWALNYQPGGSTVTEENCTDDGISTAGWFYYYKLNPSCSVGDTSSSCYTKVTVKTVEEMNNVANWYSYYRSRILTAKSGASLAFDSLDSTYRLGYGSLSHTSNGSIPFSLKPYSNNRSSFYSWLHDVNPNGSTPLRRALDDAGQYYSGSEPYYEDLLGGSTNKLSCQQNFTVLMTDGYWNSDEASTSGARADNDSNDGVEITSPSGSSFQFRANTNPFDDGTSDTLADVAMYYWKRDLRSDLVNNVPFSDSDPGFWQHMVTIGIGLGVEGNIAKQDAFAAIDSGASINWGNPTSNSAEEEKIDDLLHAAVNSRGDFFSAQNPSEFTENLKAILGTVQTRVASGTSPAVNSAQVSGERLLYKGMYRSGDWSGSLSAYGFDTDTGVVGDKQWSASFPVPTERMIFTSVIQGSNLIGAEMLWVNLDGAAQAMFGNNDGGAAEARLDYMRGDQSNEVTMGGDLRTRSNGLLGDIIHTSPVFVGDPDSLKYRYAGWSEASSHSTFASSNSNRSPVVYVSANDGMLHAFHGETGLELFAYMPRAALSNGVVDITDPSYQHRYFNDGPLTVYDVYFGNSWHTVLFGTYGRGGRGMFALDVTDPDNFSKDDVLWELSEADNAAIGQILSEPTITRLSDGTWVLLVGNGYNSDTEQSALLVIDIETGDVKVISTSTGSSSATNGMAGVVAWDASATADYVTDYAYAGDLLGNVWEFDLTNGFRTLSTSQTPRKLFTAVDSNGDAQPIVSRLAATVDPDNDPDLWLFFGTGRLFSVSDVADTQVQSWYGLKVAQTFGDTSYGISRSGNELKQRSIEEITNTSSRYEGLRVAETAVSGDMTGYKGWYIDLNITGFDGERILTPNVLRGGGLVGTSYIPIADDPCSPGGTGYVMAIDPFTGGSLDSVFFDYDDNNELNDDDIVSVDDQSRQISGVSFGDVPSKPIFVEDQMVTQLEAGGLETVKTPFADGGGANPLKRMSWREIRK